MLRIPYENHMYVLEYILAIFDFCTCNAILTYKTGNSRHFDLLIF